ncbi:ImmA/IrrE family metallo-endopeptidase [Enterococcus thailandicus]|uniref:ImmA/IrrE family metallo-endopeptidase n=1 Tax=Enterococcus thailandicus TaxID=417368 RepID=UPI0039A559B5
MAQRKVDNSRLSQSKRKLERLHAELIEQRDKMFAHQAKTNGQPMNDKRNGHLWFAKQEKLENKVRNLIEEIKQQEKLVQKLESQFEFRKQGLNKYGGLDMTIENIPRIREEIEKFGKGESKYSKATIQKYKKRVSELEQLKEKSDLGKERISPEVQAVIESGQVTQWKKNPTIYFVKGYRKLAVELNEEGMLEPSKKYTAKNEEEKKIIEELISIGNDSPSESNFDRQLAEINQQAFKIILNKEGQPFSDKDIEKISVNMFDLEKKYLENTDDKKLQTDLFLVKTVRKNLLSANEVLDQGGHNTNYRHVFEFNENLTEVMIDAKLITNELSNEQQNALMNQGQKVDEDYVATYGVVEDIKGYTNHLLSQTKEGSRSNNHYHRIEFNEKDPEHGLKSYDGEAVTLELIEQLKALDNQYTAGGRYYKFYFEEVRNGEVVNQLRMDIGDGVSSNQETYSKLAELCETAPTKSKEIKDELPKANEKKVTEVTKKTGGYKKKTPEEIRKGVKELSQQALDAVEQHTKSPEDMKELLNFMSRFPERSFRNQVLIEQQFPGASACLGQAALKKEGIYIKKGETGNQIFVRKTVKGFVEKGRGFVRENEATEADKKKIERGELEIIKKPYYTIEKVFDITQTQLKPEDYPKIFPNRVFNFELNENGQKELQAGILATAKSMNIEIHDMKEGEIYKQELGQAHGAYVHDRITGEEEIILNSRNTPTQNLATSIHELAHAKMHKFSELDTPTKELQAEMTSYIVSKHFGMDTSEKAIPYIAGWTNNGQKLNDKDVVERGKIMNDVSRVANEFIQTISTEINLYRENNLEINSKEIANDSSNIETVTAGNKTEVPDETLWINTQTGKVLDEDSSRILDELIASDNKAEVPVGNLWIDTKTGKVMEENTGPTLSLKESAFIEDPENNQVILKGKSYGKEIQTGMPSNEFALGMQFQFPKEVVNDGIQRKKNVYQQQHLQQIERS